MKSLKHNPQKTLVGIPDAIVPILYEYCCLLWDEGLRSHEILMAFEGKNFLRPLDATWDESIVVVKMHRGFERVFDIA